MRLLLALGALAAAAAVVATYVRHEALDPEGFGDRAAELADDPEIRARVAAAAVAELFAVVDVAAEIRRLLPPGQEERAEQVAAELRALAERGALELGEQERPRALLAAAFAASHEQAVSVVREGPGAVGREGGFVVLDLEPLVGELGAQVERLAPIVALLPEGAARLPLVEARRLESVRGPLLALDLVGAWLWLAPLALLAWALLLTPRGRRRRELGVSGLALAAAGLGLLGARALAGGWVVGDLVPEEADRPAASRAWEILTGPLALGAWALALAGLALLAGVALAALARPRRRPFF